MNQHPYKNLSETQFWSSGVRSPVNAQTQLAIDPLLDSIANNDSVVSGGSCFAQYIGEELTNRGYNYLRSDLSGERIESFGLGNIYTIAQLRQWLEFSMDLRTWADDSIFDKDGLWYDLLLPHRSGLSSETEVLNHRVAIKAELLNYLKAANVLIFTLGLTETWRSLEGDIYPVCPGTLIGEFDESKHHFHNGTFDEIHSDLAAVENMLTMINPELSIVYTVSPVPLTATASEKHILLATTYSKSVIRAAVGQHCDHSQRASYFPSYELISHHLNTDWRFNDNLRSISKAGVSYVMRHAFGEIQDQSDAKPIANSPQIDELNQDAICEEALLDSYVKMTDSAHVNSDIILIGDCHMDKLADGFRAAGVDVSGGIVMHGSSFTDYKFDLSQDKIFMPKDSQESVELWLDIHKKLESLKGRCNIISNIGFQTHRTINRIANHFNVSVLTETNMAEYFDEFFALQIHILQELTRYGQVWMVEDPFFYAFLSDKTEWITVREKNFYQYCNQMRKVAKAAGIEYLNPCDETLQNLLRDSVGLRDIIHPEGFLGMQAYYEYCAKIVNKSIGNDFTLLKQAA